MRLSEKTKRGGGYVGDLTDDGGGGGGRLWRDLLRKADKAQTGVDKTILPVR